MSSEALIRHPLGTTFKKEYKGKNVVVKVTKDGYVYNGKAYRSINQAVKAITKGKPVSATVFFGLTPTKRGTKSRAISHDVNTEQNANGTSTSGGSMIRDLIREEIRNVVREEVRSSFQSFRNIEESEEEA